VKSIEKDFLDNVVLQLRIKNQFLSVSATLADSERSAAATLKKGAPVTVECIGDGFLMVPQLEKCRLQ